MKVGTSAGKRGAKAEAGKRAPLESASKKRSVKAAPPKKGAAKRGSAAKVVAKIAKA